MGTRRMFVAGIRSTVHRARGEISRMASTQRGENYVRVAEEVARLGEEMGRTSAPTLVAVSKKFDASVVQEVYDAGARVFGENYVQELVAKAGELPSDVDWRFIGSLQRNKAKAIAGVPNCSTLQTLHSIKLANALQRALEDPDVGAGRTLNVDIQVNTSGEDSKSGVAPQDVLDLASHVSAQCPNLALTGLMTIGSKAASLLREQNLLGENVVISMGMSADYAQAIRQGSTCVRVGSAIFGARPVPQ